MAEKSVSITTTRIQIIAVNIKRTAVAFHNRGTAEIFVSRDKESILTKGWPIPSGGFAAFLKNDGDDTVNAMYSLTTSGVADLRVTESFEPLPIDVLSGFLGGRS